MDVDHLEQPGNKQLIPSPDLILSAEEIQGICERYDRLKELAEEAALNNWPVSETGYRNDMKLLEYLFGIDGGNQIAMS